MKKEQLLSDINRKKLINLLERNPRKFVELKKILNLESNLLSYNLKILIKEKLIEKKGFYYSLSEQTKHLMPYLRNLNNSLNPLLCVATVVMNDGKILIRKKIKEPEKGREIFIGGRINLGEDPLDAAIRHVKEKAGMKIKDLKIICINNYVSKNKEITSHYVVFFIKAKPLGKPRNAEWKEPSKLNGKMFPDNKFIIKNMLNNKRIKMVNSLYDETKKSLKWSMFLDF